MAPLAQMVAELQGRLAQMSARVRSPRRRPWPSRLQAQERILTRSLEERLAELGQRVGDRLQEQTTQATKSLTDLQGAAGRHRCGAEEHHGALVRRSWACRTSCRTSRPAAPSARSRCRTWCRAPLPPSAYSFQATLASGVRADCLADAAQPAGCDRARRQVSARELPGAARGARRRSLVPGPPPVLGCPEGACAGHRREVHRGRRDRGSGPDVPAERGRLC